MNMFEALWIGLRRRCLETIEVVMPSRAVMFTIAVIFSFLIYAPSSFYQRAYEWFTGLPGVAWIRKKLVADPPLFGERERVERLGPTWKSIPAFVRCPTAFSLVRNKPLRFALVLLWLILTIPYLLYYMVKQLHILANAYWISAESTERKSDLRATTIISHYQAGRATAEGGRKGGSSPAKQEAIQQRNEELRIEARRIVRNGHDLSEVPGILVRLYSGFAGYPTTTRQYREIIKQLKSELGGN